MFQIKATAKKNQHGSEKEIQGCPWLCLAAIFKRRSGVQNSDLVKHQKKTLYPLPTPGLEQLTHIMQKLFHFFCQKRCRHWADLLNTNFVLVLNITEAYKEEVQWHIPKPTLCLRHTQQFLLGLAKSLQNRWPARTFFRGWQLTLIWRHPNMDYGISDYTIRVNIRRLSFRYWHQ